MKVNSKSKRLSIPSLKKKLDTIFSRYIRLRDSDSNGYCKCISCGKIGFWKDMDCGHFVNRSHTGTRFDEKNCNAQCRSCNRWDEGNNIGYTSGITKKYGSKVIDELLVKKHSKTFLAAFDYGILIEDYNKKVEELIKDKEFKK